MWVWSSIIVLSAAPFVVSSGLPASRSLTVILTLFNNWYSLSPSIHLFFLRHLILALPSPRSRRKHSSSSLLHELNSSEWGSGHQSPPERPLPSDVVGVSPVAEAVEEPNGPQPVPSTRSDPCLASGFASSALEPPVRAHSDHRSLHVPIPVIPPPPTKPQHLPASGLHVPAPIARVPPPPIPRAPPKARSRPPVIINGQAPATGTRPQSIGFAVPPRPGRSAPPFAPPPPHAERSVSSNDAVAPWRSFNDIVQRRESAEACVRRRASQDSQEKREKRPFE